MQALTLGGSTAAAPPPISHILQNLQDVSPQLPVLMCPQIWGDGSKHARVHLVQDIFDVHLHDLSISHKRRTLAVPASIWPSEKPSSLDQLQHAHLCMERGRLTRQTVAAGDELVNVDTIRAIA